MPIPPAVGMSDLFGEPALPAGFRYTADVLSPAEEKDLVGRIEKLPFKPFDPRGWMMEGGRVVSFRQVSVPANPGDVRWKLYEFMVERTALAKG